MTHKFKVGDTGKTRDGRDYRVICTDVKSDSCSMVALITTKSTGMETSGWYTQDGCHRNRDEPSPLDLIPPKQQGWAAILKLSNGTHVGMVYPDKDLAHQLVMAIGEKAVAIIPIEWNEGEGLE